MSYQTATAKLNTNLVIRAKLMAALEPLPAVYHMRHFASYTIDYERQCLTGHYYQLQYLPESDEVILLDLTHLDIN